MPRRGNVPDDYASHSFGSGEMAVFCLVRMSKGTTCYKGSVTDDGMRWKKRKPERLSLMYNGPEGSLGFLGALSTILR
jgi:hypothetical protein